MERHPLPALALATAAWPAAQLAGRLLTELGALPGGSAATTGAVRLGKRSVAASPSDTDEDWRSSPVAALTGRPDGPPLTPVGAPATVARALGLAIGALGGPMLDGAAMLGARVDLLPVRRSGSRSAGGTARLMRAADDWIAVNLPRASDRELVPALVGYAPDEADLWPAVATWARDQPAAEFVGRGAMLGLAVSSVGEWTSDSVPWTLTPAPVARAGRDTNADAGRRTRVVNLGALWAGPLCAHILGRTGWDVADVTSVTRPEATPHALWDMLHAGHRQIVIDFEADTGRLELGQLLAGADVVIEASRPRALRQLGLRAETLMADGRHRTWVRITGYGPSQERVAFGDDAAVAGGLVARDREGPVFAGDAIADPLTGMTAALLALACRRSPASWIVDIPMAGVASLAAGQ